MKNILKIVFIVIVIIGLVATYVDFGSMVANPTTQQANTEASFQGPAGEPSTNGPTNTPPVR